MNWYRRLPWMAMLVCAIALTALFTASNPETADADTETRFVAVMEDSPDATMLKKADRWADPVMQLKFNEKVTWLFDVKNSIFSKIKFKGKTGYIKKNCLSVESQMQDTDSKAMVAVGGEAANTAAKGLNRKSESKLTANDPDYAKRVKQVEDTETAVQNVIFGGAPSKNMTKGRNKYRMFGKDGGLGAVKKGGE
ncbi:hypothetical protein OAU50_05025 [Planctomycetota bacterium]|nr:hypothetical protein [Planctomycetota bacterium]